MRSPSLATQPHTASTDSQGTAGFTSLFALLGWGLTALLLLAAPSQLAGFWPSDYNFWPQALFCLLLAGVALFMALSQTDAPRFGGVAWLLSLFLGWNLWTVFTSTYPHDSWLELGRVTLGLGFFFLVRAFTNPQHRLALLAAIVLGMLLPALGALSNFITTHDSRQFGGFMNPNLFATALALSLVFALALPLGVWNSTRNKALSIAALIPFFILLPALAVTSSKGGLVAAVLGLIAAVIAVRSAKKAAFGRSFKKALPFLAVALVLFGALAAKTVGPRLLNARGSDDNSTMFRVYTWRGTMNMAKARPIVGFGPGSYPAAFPAYAQAGYTRTAHQSWLQIAAESGFPALILLLGAVVLALRNGFRQLKDAQSWPLAVGSIGAILALLAHGCFDAGWSATPVIILFAVALAVVEPTEAPTGERRSALNFGWLGALLLLALAGYGTQQAAGAENARTDAQDAIRQGAAATALQAAQSAVAQDSGSARAWYFLGDMLRTNGQDPASAYEQAVALQPYRAGNWRRLAQFESDTDVAGAEKAYERALELDPLNTSLLLERAKWRLDRKDSRGYADLETLLKLWDAPYGRYPALADWINLDFARAVVALAPQLKKTDPQRLKTLIQHAQQDVDKAKANRESNLQILEAAGQEDNNADLDEIDSALQGLK